MKKYKDKDLDKKDEKDGSRQDMTKGEAVAFVREENIHTIFGGPYVGGNERIAMDKYVREAKQPSSLILII